MKFFPRTPSTISLVFTARALRDFGDGFIVLLLPVYLITQGFDAFEIGLVATLALFGSAMTTLVIGGAGARYSQRRLLLIASALMAATGAAIALSSVSWLIFLISLVGTVNPSSGSVSIFVPLEHSLLADAVDARKRTVMFANYSLLGALAAAVGSLAASAPDLLERVGLSSVSALQVMFFFYGVLGAIGGALYAQLPREKLGVHSLPKSVLGPSRSIVIKLAVLFSVDSFAGGFVVQSLMALWLFSSFGLSLAEAGSFFFVSGLLSAVSLPVAGWLGTRFGLINTMVWTHIPANLALIGAAFAPTVEVALGLLMARSLLSQMDVPVRSSYVMAVVTPAERTAAASFTAVPRSLAAALSPALAGAMLAAGYAALPLIICGVLKTAYDLALLWTFRNVRPPEEVQFP